MKTNGVGLPMPQRGLAGGDEAAAAGSCDRDPGSRPCVRSIPARNALAGARRHGDHLGGLGRRRCCSACACGEPVADPEVAWTLSPSASSSPSPSISVSALTLAGGRSCSTRSPPGASPSSPAIGTAPRPALARRRRSSDVTAGAEARAESCEHRPEQRGGHRTPAVARGQEARGTCQVRSTRHPGQRGHPTGRS